MENLCPFSQARQFEVGDPLLLLCVDGEDLTGADGTSTLGRGRGGVDVGEFGGEGEGSIRRLRMAAGMDGRTKEKR